MSPTITSTMTPSTSLQVPDSSSRQYGATRPVSVQVHSSASAAAAASSASQPPSRKRASHAVQSSSQHQHPHHHHHHQHHNHQVDDDQQPAYHDVHSHPAAVAYAAAHPRRTIPKFGPYLLLQTLGEGEFGKVKLGLHSQWGEEVAVKLIRRGNIDSTVRMSKVEREIEVLRTLKHPNIVRLYDVIETDKYIGIILEYASGGELFDHILAHRYLREKDAAKLFSQLISGVWYIHQKKIVHRDLKLENLLLDRHRNVIITDFGFANRFEHRADDLMQTSCGSPCYAAPELVISEGLYVGSAVDIWSCGVILYAMLAGYLPFDDDPANPDGDNINLLYKYIVNTPLSFPDYVSMEARDLLSMMLVPEPTRRAELATVMAHPWLAAYSSIFHKSVDDLERAAMEQHQMKRLAYQRQMKQAAGTATAAAENQARVARSQSARMDPYNPGGSVSSASRSRSYKDPSTQPEFLYETTADLSSFSTQISPPSGSSSVHRKNQQVLHPNAAISPSAPLDDDPFSTAPSHGADIPKVSLPPDAVMASVARRDSRNRRGSRDESGQVHNLSTQQPVRDSPDNSKNPAGGFRHTIQVEYGDPSDRKERRTSAQTPQKAMPMPTPSPKKDQEDTPRRQPEDRAARVRTTSQNNGTSSPANERPRKPSQTSSKPLPPPPSTPSALTPSRSRHDRSTPATPRPSPPETAVAPINVSSSPAIVTPAAAEKSLQTMRSASGSTGSQSSKQSQHHKGLSFDKLGIGKIFGSNSANDQNGASSRVPSEVSGLGLSIVTDVSSSKLNLNPNIKSENIPPASAHSASKSSLLSPGGENGKKSRRNTLTVIVGPITRTIKSRSKVRPAVVSKEKPEEIVSVQHSALPTSGSVTADESTAPGFGDVSRTEIDIGSGMQASTSKARKVMQWFRTKSKGRESFGMSDDLATGDESEKPISGRIAEYKRKVASASSATVNKTASIPAQVVITEPPDTPRTIRAPGHPQRTASSATDSSFSPHSIAARIRNSVGVGIPSGTSSGSGKSVMRIHHGAVDQTTITTRAPPEVMIHVKEILEGMGVVIQVESEYKYRCIRAKRKKTSSMALGGVRGDSLGSTNTLAAIQMAGSAASNGVDKRGLPVPQTFHGTGGMLKGLLMRRQSSQVSSTGSVTVTGSQQYLPLEDDSLSPIVSPSTGEPQAVQEPVYGDVTQDAGDEVRFSVELTRLAGLNDTFSLDIRRLKGNLRSYKFLYVTLRDRADLKR